MKRSKRSAASCGPGAASGWYWAEKIGRPDLDGYVGPWSCYWSYAGRLRLELMRKFKANLYLSRKANEGCPAKWKDEGDATLRPGPEMVGRVHEALNQ